VIVTAAADALAGPVAALAGALAALAAALVAAPAALPEEEDPHAATTAAAPTVSPLGKSLRPQ
jgi:hypothetical protein